MTCMDWTATRTGWRVRVCLRKIMDKNIVKLSRYKGPAIELLTIGDVAKLLKVSSSTVRRLQQGRQLPFIKVGGSVRFNKDDIIDFLKKVRIESID